MKEIGLYIHIPFCKQKCYYCDFVSYSNKNQYIEKYIVALKSEIRNNKPQEDIKIKTIYIGGGTPSYIDSKYIKEILDTIYETYLISKQVEITIEVNPGTVNRAKLEEYKNCKINRISIGMQECNNDKLKQIGRIHTYEEFESAYKLARQVGFKNINIDIIIGLPNQTIEDVKKTIKNVIDLNPEHISVYSLIIEENTKLYDMVKNHTVELPEEEIERKMYWYVKNNIEKQGYNHYEISNFAKPKYESKHNTSCWNQEEYIGFGLAAHSYYNKTRYSNISNINEYIKNIEIDKSKLNKTIHEKQNDIDEMKEYMLLGLRKIQGVDITKFKNKFQNNPIYIYRIQLDKLVKQNLLEITENNIRLTNKGIDLANLVWEEFV